MRTCGRGHPEQDAHRRRESRGCSKWAIARERVAGMLLAIPAARQRRRRLEAHSRIPGGKAKYDLRRAIGRRVIEHDDFDLDSARGEQAGKRCGNDALFIAGWDEHRDRIGQNAVSHFRTAAGLRLAIEQHVPHPERCGHSRAAEGESNEPCVTHRRRMLPWLP